MNQTRDLQTELSLLNSEQPEPWRNGLWRYHQDAFGKQLHLVMHKEKGSSLFWCVVLKAKIKFGELQNSHEIVSHLSHDNLSFASHVPQLPPAKLPLIYVDCLAGGQ